MSQSDVGISQRGLLNATHVKCSSRVWQQLGYYLMRASVEMFQINMDYTVLMLQKAEKSWRLNGVSIRNVIFIVPVLYQLSLLFSCKHNLVTITCLYKCHLCFLSFPKFPSLFSFGLFTKSGPTIKQVTLILSELYRFVSF